jgi:hypothetical protein
MRLLHRLVASINTHGRNKLGPRFYGLFRVLEHISEVAYKLELSRVHACTTSSTSVYSNLTRALLLTRRAFYLLPFMAARAHSRLR